MTTNRAWCPGARLLLAAVAATVMALGLSTAAAAASRTPFQQYVFADCSDGRADCKLDFDAVPAGSRLEVQNVSCHIERDAGSLLHAAQLLVVKADNTIASASTLVPVLLGPALLGVFPGAGGPSPAEQTYNVYAANHAVFVFATAGRRFQAFFRKSGTGTFRLIACHVSGHMVKLG